LGPYRLYTNVNRGFAEAPMREMAVAVVQFCPGEAREGNFETASRLLGEAAAKDARLAVLPEMFSAMAPAAKWPEIAEPRGGPVERFLSAEATSRRMYIIGGSYIEKEGGKRYNTCPVFGPDGALLGRYRKMHLFWVDIPGAARYDERSYLEAGDEQFTFTADGFRAAVGICYDLRFPEFFRLPGGAPVDLYCLGAAFMHATGLAHWEVLARSRAVENLAYFAASGTVGCHYEAPAGSGETVRTYGHSMIVSPWGEVLARLGDGDGVAVAVVKGDEIDAARGRLRALDHIREELWPRRR